MEDVVHTTAFYEASPHVCPYGCSKGFMNEFSLRRHVQESKCEKTDDLLEKIKNIAQLLFQMLSALLAI